MWLFSYILTVHTFICAYIERTDNSVKWLSTSWGLTHDWRFSPHAHQPYAENIPQGFKVNVQRKLHYEKKAKKVIVTPLFPFQKDVRTLGSFNKVAKDWIPTEDDRSIWSKVQEATLSNEMELWKSYHARLGYQKGRSAAMGRGRLVTEFLLPLRSQHDSVWGSRIVK